MLVDVVLYLSPDNPLVPDVPFSPLYPVTPCIPCKPVAPCNESSAQCVVSKTGFIFTVNGIGLAETVAVQNQDDPVYPTESFLL